MKRTVEYDGRTYKVRSDKVDIPDLDALERFSALIWLNQNTYATGYSTKKQNPLEGYGGILEVR